jgi:hypothetical protein
MPKPQGSPITVTDGQPQREVCRFSVDTVYAPVNGVLVPQFSFSSYGETKLRDANFNILWQDPTFIPISQFSDANLPSAARSWFQQICAYLDTQ